MKFTATINGVQVEKEIPTRWEELSFSKFIQLQIDPNDKILALAILTGVEKEVWLKSKIVNFEQVEKALSFLKTQMPSNIPDVIHTETSATPSLKTKATLTEYPIPKDLNHEEVGRYEDVRLILEKAKDLPALEQIKKYPEICAIYAMPNYCESTPEEKEVFQKQFESSPCWEVMAIGNFTLIKSIASKNNIDLNLSSPTTPRKKWRLGFLILRKRLAFMLRFFLWKRKLRTEGTNS